MDTANSPPMPTVPTPTINEGPPNDAPPLAAPQHGVFVRDRRRPGRVATANPSLVALMRGTAPAEPPATGAPGGRGHLLLWVIAGSAAFWAALAVLLFA